MTPDLSSKEPSNGVGFSKDRGHTCSWVERTSTPDVGAVKVTAERRMRPRVYGGTFHWNDILGKWHLSINLVTAFPSLLFKHLPWCPVSRMGFFASSLPLSS
jgi:hypothetical protein